MAFVLLNEGDDDGQLGAVRLHRGTRGDSAEFAITVRSDLKGRGYGRLLMEHIIAYAQSQGLKTLFGVVLAENSGMRGLARKLGFKARMDPEDASTVRVELDLTKAEEAYAKTP